MQIFNNWNVIAKGWYLACPSQEIPQNKAKSLELCGQKIVIFRGKDRQIRALDAYCSHLGTDLGIGQVDGNLIRCAFHHWAFDQNGICQDIPCQAEIPNQAKVRAYATEEKYGFIWIYPEAKAPETVANFDELKGKEIVTEADRSFTRNCHHHICMMNGIDAQHLKTIHHLDIKMNLSLERNNLGTQIDFIMEGKFPETTWRERLGKRFLGSHYRYEMRYADGCIGLLTMMKNVKLFPPLHIIYAYTPLTSGITKIQPIYVTEKRQGIFGGIISKFLLLCTRLAYYMLRDEDGKIYDNIQFNPKLLLPIDQPLAQYMSYVNQLQVSQWSKNQEL
jgi:phenylpropionate dioxygenase-like ring-hydroxylating dioxygenase large terminal subunit